MTCRSNLTRIREEQRISDTFHSVIAQNPDHGDDPAWLISATAYSLGVDEADARRVWRERFDIPGA